MKEHEIEELKKQVQNFIRSNEVSFVLNGKPLKACTIEQPSILSLTEGEFSNGNNYSFEGNLRVSIPAQVEKDSQSFCVNFKGYAEIEIEQEKGKNKEIKIIKVSPISLTKK